MTVRPWSRRIDAVSITTLLVLFVTGLSSLRTLPAAAQDWSPPTTVYVDAAGHTVDGLFLDFWRANRELLGEPITEEFTQDGIEPAAPGTPTAQTDADEVIVQYFENGAIAYLPDNPPGEQVEMVPLGKAAAAFVPRAAKRAFEPVDGCGNLASADCAFVEATDHTVRYGFGDLWETEEAQLLLGAPISEEFVGKDEVTFQYFESGVLSWTREDDVAIHPIGSDVAGRLDLDTEKIAPPDDLPVYDEALFIAPEAPEVEVAAVGSDGGDGGPGPQQGAYKEIVISLGQQTLWAYEDGALVTSTLVSTGTAETVAVETPLGFYQVLTKYDVQTMEGTISDEYYKVEDVPDVMYFDNLGNAIHGAYWHSNFGTPMSHGCVNAPLDIAAFLYDWAPIGTAVSVIP